VKVVLFQPQIPQNTGNIVRTCAVTGSSLVLVKPLGFSTASRHLKRAGLDYWENVSVTIIDDLLSFLSASSESFFFFSSHAKKLYTEVSYPENALLIFGSETGGLSPIFHERWPDRFCTIPMRENQRCLNLASSVSVAVYEAWRQNSFKPSREQTV
jgi:tRNA (cytidine/uridine-2'-O-)-methyltransferase